MTSKSKKNNWSVLDKSGEALIQDKTEPEAWGYFKDNSSRAAKLLKNNKVMAERKYQ